MIGFVGLLIIIGFILGIIQKATTKYLFAAFGYKGIMATSWIGTPIHELGHALMCLIFRHRITDMRLFILNPTDNTLGYVKHSYNKQSIYQNIGNFFIGIAPIFSGVGAILLSLHYLLPSSYKVLSTALNSEMSMQSLNTALLEKLLFANLNLLKSIFTLTNLINPYFWLFLIIVMGISSHMALSTKDIKGAAGGLITLFAIIFFMTMITQATETIERYIREGKIAADLEVPFGDKRTFKYFREATIEKYAKQYGWELITPANMKDKFMDMVKTMDMSFSYKPVLLKAMIDHVDENGFQMYPASKVVLQLSFDRGRNRIQIN